MVSGLLPGPYAGPVSSLLLVEDDPDIAGPLSRALAREGYGVRVADDGPTAVTLASQQRFDLVLLDLGLPGMDGIDVCRRIRASSPTLPILMLTARADEIDVVVGLDAGADDYVAKPFRLAELLARIRSVLRRSEQRTTSGSLDVRIDPPARRAWVGDEELELTPKEFDLLAVLVREAGAVVTRERLIDEVWDEHWFGPTKTLDMHISTLRRKLGDDPADSRYIVTVRGIGYRFETG